MKRRLELSAKTRVREWSVPVEGRNNPTKDHEEVDLQKKLFTVIRLKQLQPKRVQTLIWYYDLWVFVFVMLVSIRSVTMMDLKRDDWQLFVLLYWIQCFYSVLAFPFVCLIIPGVQSLIWQGPRETTSVDCVAYKPRGRVFVIHSLYT